MRSIRSRPIAVRLAFAISASSIALAGCSSESSDKAADDTEQATSQDGKGQGTNSDRGSNTDAGPSSDPGEDGATENTSTIDACKMFSADDFEAVTGVTGTKQEGPPGLPPTVLGMCSWQADDIVPSIAVTFHKASNWEPFLDAVDSNGAKDVEVDGGKGGLRG